MQPIWRLLADAPFAEPKLRDNLSRDQPRQVRMPRPQVEPQGSLLRGFSLAFAEQADATADRTKADRPSR